MTLSVVLLLSSVVTILLLLLLQSQRFQRNLLQEQLKTSQLTSTNLQSEIARLTNLLVSRDPMTYLTLQQPTALISEPYQGTGSDQDEYIKWAKTAGIDPEEYQDDLAELGLG